jgi:pyridoxine 5-phosphate synthase
MQRRLLGFRLDHIATLRQTRRALYPDPVTAASIAETLGVAQIHAHLREDRRHIQERDVRLLRQVVQGALHLEMSPSHDSVKIAYDIKPDGITLVPERKDERTTDRGLDVVHQRESLQKYVQNLRDGDLPVCLLVDPDLDQVRAAHRMDVTAVEIHTGKYADARGENDRRTEMQRVADAARTAAKLGLHVSVGHGLNYQNVAALTPIEEIETYLIGHAIVAQALWSGLEQALRDMTALLAGSRQ